MMSDSMDFSDMFKSTSSRSSKRMDSFRATFPNQSTTDSDNIGTLADSLIEESENIKPVSDAENHLDGSSFVQNYLKAHSLDLGSEQISSSVCKVLEALIAEKKRWQSQASAITDDNQKLRHQFASLTKEKNKESDGAEQLRRELFILTGKLSSSTAEHREVRNTWLAEKSDLEGKVFHIQSLNTQLQGTIKKKDKDYDKLQGQLAKIVRDASRGNKASIQLSLPLQKNLSQKSTLKGADSETGASLRDADMLALKKHLESLNHENGTLREAVESLRGSTEELHSEFESAVQLMETKHSKVLQDLHESHDAELNALRAEIERVQNNANKAKQYDSAATAEAAAALMGLVMKPSAPIPVPVPTVTAPATPPAAPTPPAKQLMITTPKRATGSCTSVALTPASAARPASWVVEQANTEVKKLRARAEEVADINAGARSTVMFPQTPSASSMSALRSKYELLRGQLSEALQVIEEQDRLIHEALLSRLTVSEGIMKGMAQFADEDNDGTEYNMNTNSSSRSSSSKGVSFAGSVELSSPATSSSSSATAVTAPSRSSFVDNLLSDSATGMLLDSDFMPPASPETIALLQTYGWGDTDVEGGVALPRELAADGSYARSRLSLGGEKAQKTRQHQQQQQQSTEEEEEEELQQEKQGQESANKSAEKQLDMLLGV